MSITEGPKRSQVLKLLQWWQEVHFASVTKDLHFEPNLQNFKVINSRDLLIGFRCLNWGVASSSNSAIIFQQCCPFLISSLFDSHVSALTINTESSRTKAATKHNCWVKREEKKVLCMFTPTCLHVVEDRTIITYQSHNVSPCRKWCELCKH